MSVTILPDSDQGWDFRQCPNAPIPGAIGGHEYGGNQYLFLFQGAEFTVGDLNIHALKSTDSGATWTDTDSIFIGAFASQVITYTTCMDGSIVYLMGVTLDGAGVAPGDSVASAIHMFKYDLTLDSFTSGPTTPSGAPTVWKFWTGAAYQPRSGICLHLLLRGAGDMLLLYTFHENIAGSEYARIYVAEFDGTSFAAGVVLTGQSGAAAFIERCACIDASGILHVILVKTTVAHSWFHIAMDSGGSFGTFQTVETDTWYQNDTSNFLDFPGGAGDAIAFLGVRNTSSTQDNGDLAIYSAAGGSLSPTWSFANLGLSNPVQNPVVAPDWLAALGYLDGIMHAFWTQTGSAPSWSANGGDGIIQTATASVSDLTVWTAESALIGPLDTVSRVWNAEQAGVWAGATIGLGVIGNFHGWDPDVNDPLETSGVVIFPPAGGVPLEVICDSPPAGKAGTTYTHTFPGSGGTPPYVFTLSSGSFPPGLTLESSTGILSGTPTTAGSYSFTIQIADADEHTDTVTCSIDISLNVNCNNPPNGAVGTPYTHTMTTSGGTPPYTYTITAGSLPPGLTIT